MAKLDDASMADVVRMAAWNTQPLRRSERPDDYPVDRLPLIVLNAVREIQEYTKAPMEMVAGCALAAVSAAVQTRFTVCRDELLVGPPGLFLMTVAESGERKSSIDTHFSKPFIERDREQERLDRERRKQYDADMEAWRASGSNPDEMPEKPTPAPRLLRGDDTPEALAQALAEYPIAFINSAEAGTILGSHAMNPDAVVRSLAQANVMWDGGTINQGRVTRESIRVSGMRVTMNLQVQPGVFQNIHQKTGGLMRNVGFLARFLFCRPETAMGRRFYTAPPPGTPHLRAFQSRVADLLKYEAIFDETGELSTIMVPFDSRAQDIWIAFYDAIESELAPSGEFEDIRDIAGKAAENVARLACCLHVFANADHTVGPIGELTMASACSLMRWYLDEALRHGRADGVPEEVRNAELLEEWLVRKQKADLRADITVNMVRQTGPGKLRVRAKLDAALDLLADHGRIRVTKLPRSKREYITIAPAVMLEWS